MVSPLSDAIDASVFGGKASQLAAAARAGLPVPRGVAISGICVREALKGRISIATSVARLMPIGGPMAVRSSGLLEDGEAASFAGKYSTHLNVLGASALVEAILEIGRSGLSSDVLAYSNALAIRETGEVGVVVQELIVPDVAGVMFTVDPVTGEERSVIEASWGLGAVVVDGRVVPDEIVVDGKTGSIAVRVGVKDIRCEPTASGGVRFVPVVPELIERVCLGRQAISQLMALGIACNSVFAGPHDIEWAWRGAEVYLLQRRPITAL